MRSGNIFFSPHDYFRKLENDNVIGDKFEGIDHCAQPNKIEKITISKNGNVLWSANGSVFSEPVRVSHGGAPRNIFCMFSIRDAGFIGSLDSRIHQFGDHFVIVTNTELFVERVSKSAIANGYNFEAGLMQYFDQHTYTGEVGVFRKRVSYEYQKEFRFAIYPGGRGAIVLNVGNICDITMQVLPISCLCTLELQFE